MAVRDPSLKSLAGFHPSDIAFFALIDRYGAYRFHSNTDLIGTRAPNREFGEAPRNGSMSEARVTLGTGEKAYEFTAPLELPGQPLTLRLTLHTYRADAVIRRAKLNMAVLFSLLAAGWVLAAILYRFARREEQHRLDMARRESLAQLGEMGAMIAHEIRNPLAGIKGYAQIIGKKPQDARNSGFARRIVSEVLRLENLVNELLAYARNDSTPLSPVNITELVCHTVSLIRHEAEGRLVATTIDCSEGLQLLGNRDRLGQALLNLAKNALQSMPDGGNLFISAVASGQNVVITVRDTGHVITSLEMERIFDPFFTTKARGTGLGLALCKKITDEHGGEISVASEPGKGTSVVISLPVSRA
jgi:two-component system sensor histidine kinase HydH